MVYRPRKNETIAENYYIVLSTRLLRTSYNSAGKKPYPMPPWKNFHIKKSNTTSYNDAKHGDKKHGYGKLHDSIQCYRCVTFVSQMAIVALMSGSQPMFGVIATMSWKL